MPKIFISSSIDLSIMKSIDFFDSMASKFSSKKLLNSLKAFSLNLFSALIVFPAMCGVAI